MLIRRRFSAGSTAECIERFEPGQARVRNAAFDAVLLARREGCSVGVGTGRSGGGGQFLGAVGCRVRRLRRVSAS